MACCRSDAYVMAGESDVPSECKGVGGVGTHKCVAAVATEKEACGSQGQNSGEGFTPKQCGAGLYCDVGAGICMSNPSAPEAMTTAAPETTITIAAMAELHEPCDVGATFGPKCCRSSLLCDPGSKTCVPDLGQAQPTTSTAPVSSTMSTTPFAAPLLSSGVNNWGEDCWPRCGMGGFCKWCGDGMACCRSGYGSSDPTECHGVEEFGAYDMHTCVRPSVPGDNVSTTESSTTTEPVTATLAPSLQLNLTCAIPLDDVYDPVKFKVSATPADCCDGQDSMNDGGGTIRCPPPRPCSPSLPTSQLCACGLLTCTSGTICVDNMVCHDRVPQDAANTSGWAANTSGWAANTSAPALNTSALAALAANTSALEASLEAPSSSQSRTSVWR